MFHAALMVDGASRLITDIELHTERPGVHADIDVRGLYMDLCREIARSGYSISPHFTPENIVVKRYHEVDPISTSFLHTGEGWSVLGALSDLVWGEDDPWVDDPKPDYTSDSHAKNLYAKLEKHATKWKGEVPSGEKPHAAALLLVDTGRVFIRTAHNIRAKGGASFTTDVGATISWSDLADIEEKSASAFVELVSGLKYADTEMDVSGTGKVARPLRKVLTLVMQSHHEALRTQVVKDNKELQDFSDQARTAVDENGNLTKKAQMWKANGELMKKFSKPYDTETKFSQHWKTMGETTPWDFNTIGNLPEILIRKETGIQALIFTTTISKNKSDTRLKELKKLKKLYAKMNKTKSITPPKVRVVLYYMNMFLADTDVPLGGITKKLFDAEKV